MKKIVDEIIYIDTEEKFNDIKQNYKREQKIYYTCSECGKEYIKSTIRSMTSINKLCCYCASKKALIDKYGVDNVFKLQEFQEKAKQTRIEKYGDENPFSFGSDRYKEIIKEKYGVDNVFQSEEIKEKIKKTCLKKYGVEYSSQAEIVKEKTKKTNLERYGNEYAVASNIVRKKAKETNLERYGSETPFPFNCNKLNEIIKEKYNVDNISQLDEIKIKKEESCLKHFGVSNPSYSKEVLSKIENTLYQRYGVKHPLQYREFQLKTKSKYIYEDINFDSSWELIFWLYNKEVLNNNITRILDPLIYYYNDEEFKYFPDFKIDDKIYEIKGDHFFNDEGILIDPWDNSEYGNGKAKAKYDCMLENHITILRGNDIKPYYNWFKEKYGIKYLNNFRRTK